MLKDYAARGKWILKENEDSPYRAADIIDWLKPAIRAGQIKANGKPLLWQDIDSKAKTKALYEDEAAEAKLVDIDPSVIVDEYDNPINLKNTPALRDWILKQYKDKEVVIKDDNTLQLFSNEGLRASLKSKSKTQRSMYAALDKLIENAIFKKDEPSDYDPNDKTTEKHKKIAKQKIYYSAARIGTGLYSVEIKIDVLNNGKPDSYKHHGVNKIDIAPTLYRGINGANATPQTAGAISAVTLDVLTGKVNPSGITDSGTLYEKYKVYRGAGYVKKAGESHHGQPADLKDGGAAYGAGTYFSSREAVGEAYGRLAAAKTAEAQAFEQKKFNGKTIEEWVDFWDDKKSFGRGALARKFLDTFDIDGTIEYGKSNFGHDPFSVFPQDIKWFEYTFGNSNPPPLKGHLYQADIDDEALADWDESVFNQPPKVQSALFPLLGENTDLNVKFGDFYQTLAEEYGEGETSAMLAEAGIQGHTYLGEYKNAGEGKDVENYVIYDDSAISNEAMLYELESGASQNTADNKSMTPEKRQEYEAFVKSAWTAAANHKEGAAIERIGYLIVKDDEGRHVIDSQKIRHIFKHHGDIKSEKNKKRIAITEDDIKYIPVILNTPSYKIKGILYDSKPSIIYAKHSANGTYVYVENPSKRKNGNVGQTFLCQMGQMPPKALLNILKNKAKYDIDKADIIIGAGGGGNTPNTYRNNPTGTAANSVYPPDTSLSHTSEKESTPLALYELDDDALAQFDEDFQEYIVQGTAEQMHDLLRKAMTADSYADLVTYLAEAYDADPFDKATQILAEKVFTYYTEHAEHIKENMLGRDVERIPEETIAADFKRLVDNETIIKELVNLARDIRENPQELDAENAEGSIYDWIKEARKIKDAQLAEKAKRGDATNSEYLEYIGKLDKKITEKDKINERKGQRIKELEQNLTDEYKYRRKEAA